MFRGIENCIVKSFIRRTKGEDKLFDIKMKTSIIFYIEAIALTVKTCVIVFGFTFSMPY